MSEFVEMIIDTDIAKAPIETWVESMEFLGFKVEVPVAPETELPLYGYQNDLRPQRVVARIDRKQIGGVSNDAGVQKHADGRLSLYLSKHDMHYYDQNDKGQLIDTQGRIVPRSACSPVLQKLWFDLPEKIKEVMAKNKLGVTMELTKKALKKLGYSKFTVQGNVLIGVGL